MIKETH